MKKRWMTTPINENRECPKADAFIADVLAVCAKHGLSIAHEDNHGAFIIVRDGDNDWFADAMVAPDVEGDRS